MVATGIWVVVADAPPAPVAVTGLVEGMPALKGTLEVVTNVPALSTVTVATVVPA